MPSTIRDFESLLSNVRKYLEENPRKDSVPREKMNKYQFLKMAAIESKERELEFLESLSPVINCASPTRVDNKI